jgi:hypothetical protein
MTDTTDRWRFMLRYGKPEHVKKIVEDGAGTYERASRLMTAVKHNPYIDDEIFKMAWRHGGLRKHVAKNPLISDELHDKALKHEDVDVQEAALMNPKTTEDHLRERHQNSEFRYIREIAEDRLDGGSPDKVLAHHQMLRAQRQQR